MENKDSISGVYQIRNTRDGKVYIGSAVDISRRWKRHLRGDHSNAYLQNAFRKHGIENFEFTIVEVCDREHLVEIEQRWIATFPSDMRYNICLVARSPLGRVVSEETKRKISIANSGRFVSDETKAKSSVAHMGHVATPEALKRQSIAQTGKHKRHGIHPPMSDDARAKLSASKMGHSVSQETRVKIGAAGLGRVTSPETKALQSAAATGKIHPPVSAETRKKISIAGMGNHNKKGKTHKAKIGI